MRQCPLRGSTRRPTSRQRNHFLDLELFDNPPHGSHNCVVAADCGCLRSGTLQHSQDAQHQHNLTTMHCQHQATSQLHDQRYHDCSQRHKQDLDHYNLPTDRQKGKLPSSTPTALPELGAGAGARGPGPVDGVVDDDMFLSLSLVSRCCVVN